jgi:hypothetical protein
MDLDKDDLSALCAGLTTDEVDRVHRLLHEWSVGPDSSFPVQLALLTKAQWRIAANLPRLMNDSRKLIEVHLPEYRRQTQAMAHDFADTMDSQNKELKKTVEITFRRPDRRWNKSRCNLPTRKRLQSESKL